ncbi:MAG: class I SAM-dependent methyltransferase [Bacteroidia bacterium]
MSSLQNTFGNIDIYLFDQIQKGRFAKSRTVIDLGCGGGRNLVYFLQQGFEVYGIDPKPEAIAVVQELSRSLAPENPIENFRVGTLEDNPFSPKQFDLVICNAVLHFAEDEAHFDRMLRGAWAAVASGGFLFIRLASDIGIESKVVPLGNGRFRLPDGSERFLVNEETLLRYQNLLGMKQLEPIKTTNVQGLRCMTTWCVGR